MIWTLVLIPIRMNFHGDPNQDYIRDIIAAIAVLADMFAGKWAGCTP